MEIAPANYFQNPNEPPEFGELTFSFDFEPVSLQSSSAKRDFIKAEITKATNGLNYLLSGDVKIEIQWLVYEQERYESANAPDMDNIIKPIVDGLTGPSGILIDDCQVQTIGSHWIDWGKHEHQINVSIKYVPDDYVTKANLIFVHLGSNLYIPMRSDLPPSAIEIIIDHLEKGMSIRNEVLRQTGDYYQAKLFMSTQRLFHKSRIVDRYNCIEAEEFKKKFQKRHDYK